GRPGRARHRADRRPGRLGESPGLLARELTASRDGKRAALLPWLRRAPSRAARLHLPPIPDRLHRNAELNHPSNPHLRDPPQLARTNHRRPLVPALATSAEL